MSLALPPLMLLCWGTYNGGSSHSLSPLCQNPPPHPECVVHVLAPLLTPQRTKLRPILQLQSTRYNTRAPAAPSLLLLLLPQATHSDTVIPPPSYPFSQDHHQPRRDANTAREHLPTISHILLLLSNTVRERIQPPLPAPFFHLIIRGGERKGLFCSGLLELGRGFNPVQILINTRHGF